MKESFISRIISNNFPTPTTERELMNIGTIRDLYADGRTPVSIQEDGEVIAIVPTSEREIKRGGPEFHEITLMPGQDILLQEAIRVEELRDIETQKLADL
jgi:hypothetical protein